MITLVTKEKIILAFQLLLGRDPENDDVVNNLNQNVHSIKQLRETFINSPEFKEEMGRVLDKQHQVRHRHPLNLPFIPVEVNVSEENLSLMFERIHQEWEFLGNSDPYWSVVTQPHYHMDEFELHREEFYLSGKYSADIFLASLRRNAINYNQFHTCLEVGCGVGRVTKYLADVFQKVIASDISEQHISLAIDYLKTQNIGNVETRHWKDIWSLMHTEKVDAIYSVITLQHNPPPIIAWMLKTLLNMLNKGGVASIQIPTYLTGYLFETERYLNSVAPKTLEMHFLPQNEIFKIIDEVGCICLEVREDTMVGSEDKILSNTFIIKRPE